MAKRKKKYWFVYIVRCGDGTFYTGITTNLRRRLSQHNAGQASRYTRSRLPVTLVYEEQAASRSTALRREFCIKAMTRRQKESLIRHATTPQSARAVLSV